MRPRSPEFDEVERLMSQDEEAARIAAKLRAADRRGLLAPAGSGSFSVAVMNRLHAAGLIDWHTFQPTELGWRVRKVLRPSDVRCSR